MSIHTKCEIDPSAVIADDATIGSGVFIGPNSVIESGVEIGPNVFIGPNTTIHEGARIYPGAIIGTDPQDIKFDGSHTTCEVGRRTILREYCTINRGSTASRATIVGADCFLMSYVHIGHDCRVGDGVVMASDAVFGGHCQVGDKAVIGGLTGVHQFVRVGTLAMVGGSSGLRQDAPPYMITAGAPPAKVYGINAIGLRRNGFTPETRSLMRRAFGLLYRSGLNFSDAIERIKSELEQTVEIRNLLDFFATSKRGVARGHTRDIVDDDDAV